MRALRKVDAGATVTDVCRRVGVSEQTSYRWKAKFGGVDVSDAKRLKRLEDENGRPFAKMQSITLARLRLQAGHGSPQSCRSQDR